MFTSNLIVVVAASFAAAAYGFEDIAIDQTVQADTTTQVTIENDFSKGSRSFDAGFDSFRVYLASTPPGWGTGPVCTLVNSTSIKTTSLTVTIPASVGPSGEFYRISTIEMNSDPNKDGPSGFEYSNDFSLTGGTGNWSQYELDGHTLWNEDYIPCSSYGCARQCAVDNYHASASDSVEEALMTCIQACPGVTVVQEEGDNYSGSNATSTAMSSGMVAMTSAGTSSTVTTVRTSSTPSSATVSTSTSSIRSASGATSSTASAGARTSTASGSASASPAAATQNAAFSSNAPLSALLVVGLGIAAFV